MFLTRPPLLVTDTRRTSPLSSDETAISSVVVIVFVSLTISARPSEKLLRICQALPCSARALRTTSRHYRGPEERHRLPSNRKSHLHAIW